MQQNQRAIIDIHELADLLGISRQAILRHRCRNKPHPLLADLPQPVMTRPRLRWWRADIEAWLDNQRTYKPAADEPAKEPVGRGARGNQRLAAAARGEK